VLKRISVPTMFLGLMFTIAGVANAQVVTCAVSSTGAAIGAVPALPGVTANASDVGHTEVGASGAVGIADMAGGGRVRISCSNTNPAGVAPAAVNPGVVALTVNFGVPITNSQTHPSTAAAIRLINGTGAFATPGPAGPADPNPGNVGIAAIDNAAGQIVIALGTPGATTGGGAAPVVPNTGITFAPGSTSTFELAGWLLSTNGRSGAVNATLTSTGGVGIVAGSGACSVSPGPCAQVIASVKPSLQEPTVPAGALPAAVTSLPNLGLTPIAGGPAVIYQNGIPLKTNFTIRIRENYPDLFKSGAQFNTGAVFPASSASSVQVNVVFNNIPPGFDISGCAAVLTDVNGAAPALPGGATVSTSTVSAASKVLTVLFMSPVDQANVDLLWVTCTKVALGAAALPLPSTPVTAQIFLGQTGDALSSGLVLTGLTTGVIPRYAPPQALTSAFNLISFGTSSVVAPSTTPASITAVAGTPQTMEVGATFNTLRVTVRDRFDNLVSGATVTFTANDGSTAGVMFPRGNTAVTDVAGQASIDVRANFSIGSYTVTATSGTASPAVFTLTNTQRLTVALPALVSAGANQLGIAWTNTLSRSITLRATARGYDGQLIAGNGVQNPVELTIPAAGQIARLASEIFGAGIAGRSGWVELTASDPGVNGFFQLFDNGLSTSDGGTFPTAPSARLVFPHVDKDTILYIVNTGDQPVPATAVVMYDNNGILAGSTTLSLAAKSGWNGRITDLLPALQGIDGYVVVDSQGAVFAGSSETLVGMQNYLRGDAAIVLGQADSELVRTGYAVHVAIGGGYATRLSLVNPASVEQQLQLTMNGTTVQRRIPGFGRLDESLAQIFNISAGGLTTGHLKLQTSGGPGVSGYVEITAADGFVRTTTAIARDAQTRLMFSHIAQGGGYFTGLALLNTGAASATATIEVHSPNGATLASKVVTLQAGERLIGLLSELFPNIGTQLGGFVRVDSTQPIHGLQIFGGLDQRSGSFLTNIPAGTF
jgi:hypothetical protein